MDPEKIHPIHRFTKKSEKEASPKSSESEKISHLLEQLKGQKPVPQTEPVKSAEIVEKKEDEALSQRALPKVRTRTSSESEYVDLLKQLEKSLKQEIDVETARKINARVRKSTIDYVDEYKRIMQVATPQITYIPKEKMLSIESAYHETIKELFNVANGVVDGSFGPKIQEKYMIEDDMTIPFISMVALLLVYISKTPSTEEAIFKSEIFAKIRGDHRIQQLLTQFKDFDFASIENLILQDETELPPNEKNCLNLLKNLIAKMQMDILDVIALEKIFKNFLQNLYNPSHLSHLFINYLVDKLNILEQAIDISILIKNPIEKTKSLELLIDKLLSINEYDYALTLWRLIPIKKNKYQIINTIVEKYIDSGLVENTLYVHQDIKDDEERDNVLRELAFQLAKNKHLVKALEAADTIHDFELKSYTKSKIVHILCSQLDFNNAKKIALNIEDPDYKEDAVNDIVKTYLLKRNFDEAIHFVNSLPNMKERRNAAKRIESALKAFHQDEKVQAISKMFPGLYGTTNKIIREAA